jgi:DNA-binding YbaB/EbfC family protein
MGDMGSLLKQAQLMQRELDRVKAELAEREIEGTAGGRAVIVTLTAARSMVNVEITEEARRGMDAEALAELVRLALTAALEEAEEVSRTELGKVTGGLDLPGLM